MNRVVKLCLAGSLVLAILGIPALSLGPRDRRGAGLRSLHGGHSPTPIRGSTAAASSFESGTLDGFGISTAGTGNASVSTGLSHSGNCAARPAHHRGARLHRQADGGPDPRAPRRRMRTAGSTSPPKGWRETMFLTSGSLPAASASWMFSGRTSPMNWCSVRRHPAGFTYTTLRQDVPTDSWHRLVMHVVPNGPGTNVQIWWDGRSVYAGTVSISATTLDTVQLGSEHDQQMADIYIDDVIVNSGTGTPAPVPGPLPEPKGDPSQRFDDFRGDGQSGLLAAGGRCEPHSEPHSDRRGRRPRTCWPEEPAGLDHGSVAAVPGGNYPCLSAVGIGSVTI